MDMNFFSFKIFKLLEIDGNSFGIYMLVNVYFTDPIISFARIVLHVARRC